MDRRDAAVQRLGFAGVATMPSNAVWRIYRDNVAYTKIP
jgi:hypothetical protein